MSDKIIFQIPAEISKFETKLNGAVRLKIDTQENIPAEHVKRLIDLVNTIGWFTFSNKMVDPEDIFDLPKIKLNKSEGKTPSQRLHAVLYVLHKQKGGEEKDFDTFYKSTMEKLINHYKDQLQ